MKKTNEVRTTGKGDSQRWASIENTVRKSYKDDTVCGDLITSQQISFSINDNKDMGMITFSQFEWNRGEIDGSTIKGFDVTKEEMKAFAIEILKNL